MNDDPGFVPVVIVGAGPTGITAATLLAQYGVDCLVLDRWADVYPQPRAVHLDDEIYRFLAGLGIADEFAAISRPAQGLRLLDRNMRVLAEFRPDSAPKAPTASRRRTCSTSRSSRRCCARTSSATRTPSSAATPRSPTSPRSARTERRSTFTDRVSGEEHRWRRATCWAATAPTAWSAPRSAPAWRT